MICTEKKIKKYLWVFTLLSQHTHTITHCVEKTTIKKMSIYTLFLQHACANKQRDVNGNFENIKNLK